MFFDGARALFCVNATLGRDTYRGLLLKSPKNKKLRDPFLPTFTEVETPQVTPAKLPYGTRELPLRAATFLS